MKKRIYISLIVLLLFVLTGCEKCQIFPNSNSKPTPTVNVQNPRHFNIHKIVVDGNSFAQGIGSSTSIGISPTTFDSMYTGYNTAIINLGFPFANVYYGGQNTWQMIDQCQDVENALIDSSVLIVDECTNDLFQGTSTDSAFYHLKRYCQERKQNHPSIKIIVVTPTPRNNNGTPSDFESKRLDLIQRIKNSNDFYDELANVGEDSIIGQTGQCYNTIYYTDLVHHTDQGYQIRGQYIINAIRRIQSKVYIR